MENSNLYCEFVQNLPSDNVHRIYHDTEYGFPVNSDNELFGRLVLEINQAGLSWDIILKKKMSFKKAFSNFNIQKIARYNNNKISELMNNADIIRNKLKINAVIYNANQIMILQKKYGSFKNWLDQNSNLNLENWIKIFKINFKFTGKEITKEFLISTGYLDGAHHPKCQIYNLLIQKKQIG